MKLKHALFGIPVILMLMGSSCSPTRPDIGAGADPEYPANTLTECPGLTALVVDSGIDGVKLREFYLDSNSVDKQYADCATIHNELVRFIKSEQEKKKKK